MDLRGLRGRYRSAVDVSDLAEMLERHRAAAGVVGAAAGIASADQTVVAAAGHASIEPAAQVKPATRFHVVSVTEVMVATVVTRLVAAGAWSIDDSLARHVPEVRSSSWSSDVTSSSPREHRRDSGAGRVGPGLRCRR